MLFGFVLFGATLALALAPKEPLPVPVSALCPSFPPGATLGDALVPPVTVLLNGDACAASVHAATALLQAADTLPLHGASGALFELRGRPQGPPGDSSRRIDLSVGYDVRFADAQVWRTVASAARRAGATSPAAIRDRTPGVARQAAASVPASANRQPAGGGYHAGRPVSTDPNVDPDDGGAAWEALARLVDGSEWGVRGTGWGATVHLEFDLAAEQPPLDVTDAGPVLSSRDPQSLANVTRPGPNVFLSAPEGQRRRLRGAESEGMARRIANAVALVSPGAAVNATAVATAISSLPMCSFVSFVGVWLSRAGAPLRLITPLLPCVTAVSSARIAEATRDYLVATGNFDPRQAAEVAAEFAALDPMSVFDQVSLSIDHCVIGTAGTRPSTGPCGAARATVGFELFLSDDGDSPNADFPNADFPDAGAAPPASASESSVAAPPPSRNAGRGLAAVRWLAGHDLAPAELAESLRTWLAATTDAAIPGECDTAVRTLNHIKISREPAGTWSAKVYYGIRPAAPE
jgi:hypothetical protein